MRTTLRFPDALIDALDRDRVDPEQDRSSHVRELLLEALELRAALRAADADDAEHLRATIAALAAEETP